MKHMSKLIHIFLRPFWRMTRGMTLGAQAVVIDDRSRILLVRHGYRPGWHFPGGGVEWNETIEQSLERELKEETGVELTGPARLHGIFSNFRKFKGDHICVFLVENWQQPNIPKPNAEIREIGFFFRDDLPEETVTGVKNRIDEIFKGKSRSTSWN